MAITFKGANKPPVLTQADPIDLGIVPTPGDLWIIQATAGSIPGFTKIAGPLQAGINVGSSLFARQCETGDTGQVIIGSPNHWITALFGGASATPDALEELDDQGTGYSGLPQTMAVPITVPGGEHVVVGFFDHDNTLDFSVAPGTGWTEIAEHQYHGSKLFAACYKIVGTGGAETPTVESGFNGFWYGFAAAFPAAGLPEPPGGLIIE